VRKSTLSEVEPSAAERDSRLVITELAEAPGSGRDQLMSVVKTFADGVCGFVSEVTQNNF
jgi:hypothetical protein